MESRFPVLLAGQVTDLGAVHNGSTRNIVIGSHSADGGYLIESFLFFNNIVNIIAIVL